MHPISTLHFQRNKQVEKTFPETARRVAKGVRYASQRAIVVSFVVKPERSETIAVFVGLAVVADFGSVGVDCSIDVVATECNATFLVVLFYINAHEMNRGGQPRCFRNDCTGFPQILTQRHR